MKEMLDSFYAWCDDKTQVIFVLAVFGTFNFFWSPQSEQIMGNIVSGLLGVALGRALEKQNGNTNIPNN